MPEFASFESQPEIEGSLQLPKIKRDKHPPRCDPMARVDPMEMEEAAAAKVTFTGAALKSIRKLALLTEPPRDQTL